MEHRHRSPGGPDANARTLMGIMMRKMALLASALAMFSGSAMAADMVVKAVKAPPPPPFEPWDFAFGSALMSDYVFRGITQSNHKPSVGAYFEPRYNVTKDVQLYLGAAGASISFPNRAAAEIDIYGGIRPTIGMFAFDFGVWGYPIRAGRASTPPRSRDRAFPARRRAAPLAHSATLTRSPAAFQSTATSPRRTPASMKAMPRST